MMLKLKKGSAGDRQRPRAAAAAAAAAVRRGPPRRRTGWEGFSSRSLLTCDGRSVPGCRRGRHIPLLPQRATASSRPGTLLLLCLRRKVLQCPE